MVVGWFPENGFGLGFGINVTRVSDPAQVAVLEEALQNLGETATPAEDMAKSLVGDAASPYQSMVEDGWLEFVLKQ